MSASCCAAARVQIVNIICHIVLVHHMRSTNGFSSMTDEMLICQNMGFAFNRPQQRPRTRSSGVSIGMQRASSLPVLVPPLTPPQPAQARASNLAMTSASSSSRLELPDLVGRRDPRRDQHTRVPYPYFSSPKFDRLQGPKRMAHPASDANETSDAHKPSPSVSHMDDPVRVYVLRKNRKSHLIHPARLPALQSHSVRKS